MQFARLQAHFCHLMPANDKHGTDQKEISMSYVGNFIGKQLGNAWDNLYWLMMEMDVTQWGILAVLFVATGFAALRTRF